MQCFCHIAAPVSAVLSVRLKVYQVMAENDMEYWYCRTVYFSIVGIFKLNPLNILQKCSFTEYNEPWFYKSRIIIDHNCDNSKKIVKGGCWETKYIIVCLPTLKKGESLCYLLPSEVGESDKCKKEAQVTYKGGSV